MIFDPLDHPRVFALPPGADFTADLANGFLSRINDHPPEFIARTQILVNTRRMQRRLKSLFIDGGARLLPKIGLVTEIEQLLSASNLPKSVSPLRRKLDLMQLLEALLNANSTAPIAPRSAIVDLAESLAALLDEIQGEDVSLATLQNINVAEHAAHWQQSLRFLEIAHTYTQALGQSEVDRETRLRMATLALTEKWAESPPRHPIILAGSTGSRATTALLMDAVSRLPQGALILPGFDFFTPPTIWNTLQSDRHTEEHPQFRYATLLKRLGLVPQNVTKWVDSAIDTPRNRLISLSLRPAPVTDSWRIEGPELGDLIKTTQSLTLIEAPQPRDEAQAIAVAMRQAVEENQTVALVTPDRTLGRRVSAALSRWSIIPDDSSGRPLSLTAPGRLLRQVAALIGAPAPADALIALLKHPLVHSDGENRGQHLLFTREFELFMRDKTHRFADAAAVEQFGKKNVGASDWCSWLTSALQMLETQPGPSLQTALNHHTETTEFLAHGGSAGTGALWDKAAGREILALIDGFRQESSHQGQVPFTDYVRLFETTLSAENTRISDDVRPDVMIWGTLEARVQGADTVILGGLNEGTWPARPSEDPWLSRSMRKQAGMLLPERQIGLAAHDYQQAISARKVILSRAKRDEDSETVPSRWLNRLYNLLSGLEGQGGQTALTQMQARGDRLLAIARQLEAPTSTPDPEERPAPAPSVALRPKTLSVTEIQTLIRDPYAIYAKHILGLRPLNPLCPEPDARHRGIILHKVAETAFKAGSELSKDRLLEIARAEFDRSVSWPTKRTEWLGALNHVADRLIDGEQLRRTNGRIIADEIKGEFMLPESSLLIKGKADRIDRLNDGTLAIFDYKTGAGPTQKQIKLFDRQLLIEAIMAEYGAFEDLAAAPTSLVSHIRLGRSGNDTLIELTDHPDYAPGTALEELVKLLNAYMRQTQGYVSKRMVERENYSGDYDHLARFGEWDLTQSANTVVLP